MKKNIREITCSLLALFIFFPSLVHASIDQGLYTRVRGSIILQVESVGEAYYVDPVHEELHYLGKPDDAFAIMRSHGIGIANVDLAKIVEASKTGDRTFGCKHKGKIFLQIQAAGEAWYVNPKTCKRSYLGRPSHAFAIMRTFGIGISNGDLYRLGVPSLKTIEERPEIVDIKEEVKTGEPLVGSNGGTEARLTRAGIIEWTNKQRALNDNLKPYNENELLNKAARKKAEDMFAKQYFEHISPDGKGPSDIVTEQGYSFIMIAENIALGNFKDDEDLVNAWMDSPAHRASILNSNYTEMGAATMQGIFDGRSMWIAVQEFALPTSACPGVDEALKNKIDATQKEISEKSVRADDIKNEILILPRDTALEVDAYNQKVEEYNALIQETNALVAQQKNDIQVYNAQVRAFNACIGS